MSTDMEEGLVLLLLLFLPCSPGAQCAARSGGQTDRPDAGPTMLGCDWSNSLNDLLPLVNPLSIFPLSDQALALVTTHSLCSALQHIHNLHLMAGWVRALTTPHLMPSAW